MVGDTIKGIHQGVAMPISEVNLRIPTDEHGWSALVEPFADVINRGDVPTEMGAAKMALMQLRQRASGQVSGILGELEARGVLASLMERLQAPVPPSMPAQSIWWREVCLSRLNDLHVLSIFCHSFEAIGVVGPHRAEILKTLRALLASPMFSCIAQIQQATLEMILSMLLLAPDFKTFMMVDELGLTQALLDVITSQTQGRDDREEWAVYDLGSPMNPFLMTSLCLHIFSLIFSECNTILHGPVFSAEAKSLLLSLSKMPIFKEALDSVRNQYHPVGESGATRMVDFFKHLSIVFIFGGREQCLRLYDGSAWIDAAVVFLLELPKSFIDNGSRIQSELVVERLKSDSECLVKMIMERHVLNGISSRVRIPDSRHKYREIIRRTYSKDASPGQVEPFKPKMSPVKELGCATCGSVVNLKKCQRCLSIQYCSKPCQVSNWREHKIACCNKA